MSTLTQTKIIFFSPYKLNYEKKDWGSLQSAIHKIIPSFSIMGISTDFENMAKKVKEYAVTMQQGEGMPDMVLQLEKVCTQACLELKEELLVIKQEINEK